MMRRREVAAAFGAAAAGYEEGAQVQRHAARQLAEKLFALPLPDQPRVLELGCGSGLLSQHLLAHRPQGRFLLTDASLAMVQAGRQRIVTTPACWFAVMDGENPAVTAGFDLIASGLTWQWFEDPLGNLSRVARLLRPGGWLVFSTLGALTFREWRLACEAAGVVCGILTHPTRADWERHWPQGGRGFLEEELLSTRHASALAFLQSLQAIGANRPAPGHRPVSSGALRRLLRHNQEPFTASYHIHYLFYQAHA